MNILVFAPHNDDETLGLGGTIAKYAKQKNSITVCEVTSYRDKIHASLLNRIKTEAREAHKLLGVNKTVFLDLPVVELKSMATGKINAVFNDVVHEIKPEIVFIPHKGDMHIDHFEVAKAALVALRPHINPQLKAIYAYETLSETEWNNTSTCDVFMPNTFVDITETLSIKLKAMECYQTQLCEYPHPRSLEAIEALAKYRGATVCVKAAEAFMLLRQVI